MVSLASRAQPWSDEVAKNEGHDQTDGKLEKTPMSLIRDWETRMLG
jgi:hypothetical protein